MPKILNAFDIKIIAAIAMVIDHIGYLLLPNMFFLRMIGRLSFPLFAWMIANGALHTRSIDKYLERLLVFAVISQAPSYFFKTQTNPSFMGLNVLFTLFFGLLAIKGARKDISKLKKLLFIMLCVGTAQFLGVEYGGAGVLSVLAFYLFFNNAKYLAISQSCIFILPYLAVVIPPFFVSTLSKINLAIFNEPLGLISLPLIFAYNGNEGKKLKYFFYFFYPLQFIAIIILKAVIK